MFFTRVDTVKHKQFPIGVLLYSIIVLGAYDTVLAQNKKAKPTKQERKLERFREQRQAIMDTSFLFQTKKIVKPFLSNNGTGGYFQLNKTSIRIQEVDWIERLNTRTRIHEIASLVDYQIINASNSEKIVVKFSCLVQGTRYFIQIDHNLEAASTLVMSNDSNLSTTYSGKVKGLFGQVRCQGSVQKCITIIFT